jgi:hypothetical protein
MVLRDQQQVVGLQVVVVVVLQQVKLHQVLL